MKQELTNKIADCVEALMNGLPEEIDMAIIASAITQVMKQNKVEFIPHFELVDKETDLDKCEYLCKFESTSDYFFDALNSKKISRERIEFLINQTIA